MSLKWYPNARIDETQEAYGKTWRVDKVENDGAIVFRCGKETAMAPRTDSPAAVKAVWKPIDFGQFASQAANIERHPIKDDRLRIYSFQSPVDQAIARRQRENRQRQAENADKVQKAVSEALVGVGAKLLVHDCYTCDVDMRDVDDRIKSFIGGMAPKSDLSYKALEEYIVHMGWAEKGWNGI